MPSMSNEGSSSRYPLICWKGAAVLDMGTALNVISTKPTDRICPLPRINPIIIKILSFDISKLSHTSKSGQMPSMDSK